MFEELEKLPIDPASTVFTDQAFQSPLHSNNQARLEATINWQRDMLRHTIEHTTILRRMQKRYHCIVCLLIFIIILLISGIVVYFIKNTS